MVGFKLRVSKGSTYLQIPSIIEFSPSSVVLLRFPNVHICSVSNVPQFRRSNSTQPSLFFVSLRFVDHVRCPDENEYSLLLKLQFSLGLALTQIHGDLVEAQPNFGWLHAVIDIFGTLEADTVQQDTLVFIPTREAPAGNRQSM